MSATVIVTSDTRLELAALVRRLALYVRSDRLLVLSSWLLESAVVEQPTP